MDPMTLDALAGRLVVLEAVTMVALAAVLRNAPNDAPQPASRIVGVLDGVKIAAKIRASELPSPARHAAMAYLDDVLAMFSESLVPRAEPLT
jgi:hypothetical protein